MKKILLLSDASSEHTEKWAKGIVSKEFEVFVFSLIPPKYDWHKNIPNLQVEYLNFSSGTILSKLRYLLALKRIKKTIKKFKPDILHAHYATSYGLLGALSGFKPFLISVWGSDVYDFPVKSIFHKKLLAYNLSKADKILSTSKCMAIETNKYTSKTIAITPFGINTTAFKNIASNGKKELTIGTIKPIEIKYGTNDLIHVFKKLVTNNPTLHIKFMIVGVGSIEQEMKHLAQELGIGDKLLFTGRVPFDEIVKYHNLLDIYVALSIFDSESFGVATVEASACEKPVVVTDVSGFKEVVLDSQTGFIVPRKNIDQATNAIQKLIDNPQLRIDMGKKGREFVIANYEWKNNLQTMIDIYDSVLTAN